MNNLLPLTDDFVFKAVFGSSEEILKDLLNSFPGFQGESSITKLIVLNPEIPRESIEDKLSILDIKAEDSSGRKFLIEMQVSSQSYFPERIAYYWANFFAKSIVSGQNYKDLPKVISINFLNYNFLPEGSDFHSVFKLLSDKNSEILLTDRLEIHTIELQKLQKQPESLQTDFETWIYAMREMENLEEGQMKKLEKKNPRLKTAFEKVKFVSYDPNNRKHYEMRRKAEFDHNSRMEEKYQQGKSQGLLEGIEKGKQEGILEFKFQTAKNMLAEGFNTAAIAKITGLSIAEILKLDQTA